MSKWSIRKVVLEASAPTRCDANGKPGFTKQKVAWEVVSPAGGVVRVFNNKRMALYEIKRRKARKRELDSARGQAHATGERIQVRRRGRATVTVWIDPERKEERLAS